MSAWDALPAIVPFFGALTLSLCCGLNCLNRRMNRLHERLALLEQMRLPAPSAPPVLPNPPPSAPPSFVGGVSTPPSYPMPPPPTYPSQPQWPPYRAYISNTI